MSSDPDYVIIMTILQYMLDQIRNIVGANAARLPNDERLLSISGPAFLEFKRVRERMARCFFDDTYTMTHLFTLSMASIQQRITSNDITVILAIYMRR